MEPKVSIIIPVYNSEQYLHRCFKSILENNYNNLEVIVVNDGSPDNSQAIIDEYVEKYPDIFVSIVEENQGIGMARNNALEKVTGQYIMFMDNDDFIDNDYIITHVNALKENDYDMVLSGYKRVTDDKELFSVHLEDYPWTRYISIAPWGRLYKASFLKNNDIRFLKTKIGEDVYFNLQTNTLTENIKILDYAGYNWYHNNVSVTNTISNKIKGINIVQLLDTHYGILKEKNSINEKNYDLLQIYFLLLIIQFLQWLSSNLTFRELSSEYNKFFEWMKNHFPKYKKVKCWRLTKGDRIKIRLIIKVFMLAHKIGLGKLMVYVYGKLI